MACEKKIAEASISLVLRAQQLDFATIGAALGYEATATRRKGEMINKLPEIIAEADEWVYTVPLFAPDGEDAALSELLDRMLEREAETKKLREAAEMTLRLYVQSDHARIAYCLMPETLRKLALTGMPLQVSTLSWGEMQF